MGRAVTARGRSRKGSKGPSGHCPGGILIIDDDPLIREVLFTFLSEQGHEVELAADLNAAKAAIIGQSFDLILLDIVYPEQKHSGFDIMNDIRKHQPGCPVVLITAYPSTESAVKALHKNAFDYLMKPVKFEELERVTNRALQFKTRMDEAGRLKERMDIESINPIHLTKREKDILTFFAKGFSYNETARHMGCKPSTIQTYAKRLYKKLNVHSRSEAVFEAIHLGIINY